MTTYKTVQKIGSMEIFVKNTDGNMTSGYYWRDTIAVVGYGPFAHIHEAANHYVKTVNQRKSNIAYLKPQNKVIEVNFITKQRV